MNKDNKELLQVVAYLNAAVANIRLYSSEHPQASRYLKRLLDMLQQALIRHPDLTFIIVDDEVVVENRPLVSKTPHLGQFARLLRQKTIERISFGADVSLNELADLADALAAADRKVVRSSPHIKLGRVKIRRTPPPRGKPSPEVHQKLQGLGLLDNKPLDEMKELMSEVKTLPHIPTGHLEEIVHGFVQGMLCNVNPLDLLASLKSADEYTFTHAINVCILTMAQAEMLALDERNMHAIGIAAAMHDAGKMFVPDEILNKPGKLSDQEWALMRHHTVRGARYILRSEGLPKLAFIAALEHHIRYDGSGYPDLGKSWRPHIVSQMIAVADIFDAMRSRRPYQPPKPDELIVQILIDESGTAFNPYLVRNFLQILDPSAVENAS